MSAGSYARFVVGLVLSVAVLASYLSKEGVSTLSAMLALLYVLLAILWAAFRF